MPDPFAAFFRSVIIARIDQSSPQSASRKSPRSFLMKKLLKAERTTSSTSARSRRPQRHKTPAGGIARTQILLFSGFSRLGKMRFPPEKAGTRRVIMLQVTLSEIAVAVLRFEIKGGRAKNKERRLPAYRELADAGIMELVTGRRRITVSPRKAWSVGKQSLRGSMTGLSASGSSRPMRAICRRRPGMCSADTWRVMTA